MKILAYSRIKNGQLTFNQRSKLIEDLKMLRDGDYLVTIERERKTRGLQQNKYYWGVVVPLVKQGLLDIGYRLTTEAVHEYLKGQFNIKEIVNENSGEILKAVGSTTEMSTVEMIAYFEAINQWASEYLNVEIPEPNQQLTISI